MKIKIGNSLHLLIAQMFLVCFHCGAISTLSPNTRVAIFPDKRISLRSIAFITTTNWKPITLYSGSIFTLIKKNLRDLVVGNYDFF